jgi:hypothetical protein
MILPINTAEILQNDLNLPVVYIAGMVSGLPYEEVKRKFKMKQLELEALDFFVLNPVEIVGDGDCNWAEAMRVSVMMLANADYICLLPDWHLSKGATLEQQLAMKLGISTIND